MNSRNSFSLNTSPVESEGGSPADAIDESFWQIHLWPSAASANAIDVDANSQPPPDNIFGPGSVSGAGGGGGGFAFPLLGGGGAPVKVDDRNVGKKRGSDEDVIISGTDHVSGERERRKKMRSMFTTLHALLPRLSDKVDKSTIVNEAISLIKTLETSLQNLKQKADKLRHNPTTATYEPPSSTTPQLKLARQTTRESFLAEYGSGPTSKPQTHQTVENGPNYDQHGGVIFQTWTSSNVVLNTFGKNEALIMACSPKKPGLLTAIVAVLVKHKVEVENLHAFSNEDQCSYMIHARLANGASEQHPNSSAEEVYKQAVGELMLLVVDNAVTGGA